MAKGSNNAALPAGREHAPERTRAEEMAAVDRLPPAVRRVLRDTVFDISATDLLTQVELRHGRVAGLDFAVKRADEDLAREFRRGIGKWW
jgi:hypothetical protein